MIRYDSYKDSGVEWIGEIPSHWGTTRIKYTPKEDKYSFIDGDWIESKNLSDDGVRYITTGNIGEGKYKEQGKGYITEETFEALKCTEIYEGDLIISRLSLPVGRSCILPHIHHKVVTSVDNVILRPKEEFDKYYLNYQFNSPKYFEYTELISRGVTLTRISRGMLGNNPIVIPPLSEQQQIVSFLDSKTSQIDALIQKKFQKISLLKEYRTALINQVVTKGLNPNTEMKNSGVDWIGEIPRHWKVGKIYQYSEMKSGSTPSRNILEYWDGGTIPWMSSGEINKRIIKQIDGRITELGHRNSNTPLLPIGTVMIGLNGQGKTKGTVGILATQTTSNQSLCGMIFKSTMSPKFCFYFLDSQYNHIRGLVGDGQRDGISVSFLGRYSLLTPPLSEQQRIVDFLDEETSKIDFSIKSEEVKIELLKEYRQSLISEVVTGKIKVF